MYTAHVIMGKILKKLLPYRNAKRFLFNDNFRLNKENRWREKKRKKLRLSAEELRWSRKYRLPRISFLSTNYHHKINNRGSGTMDFI